MKTADYRKTALKLEMLCHVAAGVWNLKLDRVRFNEAMFDAYGRCWFKAGLIELRLMTLTEPVHMMTERVIRNTMAHEIAHLAESGHNKRHRKITEAIELWLTVNWNRKFKLKIR